MDESGPPVLWGRTQVRPTLLGTVVVVIGAGTFVAGWGMDDVAIGLLRGICVGIVIAGVISSAADLRSFRPRALSIQARSDVGRALAIHEGLGPLRPSIDLRFRVGSGPVWSDDAHAPPAVVPDRRGRYTVVTVEVSTIGVVGALRLSRSGFVPLSRPLWVCPEPAEAAPVMSPPADPPDGTDAGDLRAVAVRSTDLTSGVRPMVQGDLIRHAHWPATARRGSIHVREFEHPQDPPVAVVVDLSGDESVDEEVVARARATIRDLHRRGSPVMLHVSRPDGPHVALADEDIAFRLLAEAVGGSTPRPVSGGRTVVVAPAASVPHETGGMR